MALRGTITASEGQGITSASRVEADQVKATACEGLKSGAVSRKFISARCPRSPKIELYAAFGRLRFGWHFEEIKGNVFGVGIKVILRHQQSTALDGNVTCRESAGAHRHAIADILLNSVSLHGPH